MASHRLFYRFWASKLLHDDHPIIRTCSLPPALQSLPLRNMRCYSSPSTTPNLTKRLKNPIDQCYHVGYRLKPSVSSHDVRDDNGLPKFGKFGIPIRYKNSDQKKHNTRVVTSDNCRCQECVNQDTMQRSFDTFSIPEDIMPESVTLELEGLRILWAGDGHVSMYDWDWLMKHSSPKIQPIPHDTELQHSWQTWDPSTPAPSVLYDEIMADDKGVGVWTAKIHKWGFCYVDGCPVTPKETEELLERISFIRRTHYGGFYDFTADLTMKDTAYTNLALPAHTDTTYFTDPAGLQMFHLLSHTEGSGGASLLVDGFEAARKLREEDESAFDILASKDVSWHAIGNEGITITPKSAVPVLELYSGDLERVRWNNDDRGVVSVRKEVTKGNAAAIKYWYAAARKWNAILKRKEMENWTQLEPGRPLIFDNWRMLHGRSAFTGKRRICGGYINHDDYISRWRNTNFPREEVLKQIL